MADLDDLASLEARRGGEMQGDRPLDLNFPIDRRGRAVRHRTTQEIQIDAGAEHDQHDKHARQCDQEACHQQADQCQRKGHATADQVGEEVTLCPSQKPDDEDGQAHAANPSQGIQ